MNHPSRLGPYIIEREVGRGGMGVVYLGRDPRLDRPVAIKVLPDDVAQDPERLARFEREARLLASLNHPNIAGIYGIEEADGKRFLSLEYIEGPTLEERLRGGAMPLDEALDVCRQIAAALETAHENGIIHRDLKPANVKLTPDGGVKVLDFGLAKGVTAEGDSASNLTQSPTLTANFTAPGVILGTAAYMSPEQARGKPMDRRTDIFSFGCVLYECLTGRQLFAGETVSDTIAKILEREPDWSALPGSTPQKVRDVLRRCLEKDARKRQRDIGDARLAFDEVEEDRSSAILSAQEAGARPAGRNRSAAVAWGIAILASVVAIVSLGTSGLFKSEPPQPAVRFTVTAPPDVRMMNWPQEVVLSPDGQSLLWRGFDADGTSRFWIRSLEILESRPLPGTELGLFGFWSPDGRSVAFIDGTKLRRMSVDGGDPQPVCDATSTRGGTWGAEHIVYASEVGPLQKVQAAGGKPEPATTLAPGQTAHRFPHFLPDGRTFLYVALPSKAGRVTVFASDVEGREPVEILSAVSSPVYAEPGYLLFQRGRRIMAQRFDAGSLELSGEPVVIGDAPARPQAVGAPALSASRNGRIAFLKPQDRNTRLVWFDREGNVTGTLDLDPGRYVAPAISPDGRHVAVAKEASPEESDIWVVELERMVVTRVTSGPGLSQDPVWSPDGKSIAYSTDADGPWNIYRKPFPGGGDPQPVAVGPATFKNPLDWSPDGKYFLYEQIGPGTNLDLWIAPLDGGEPYAYLAGTHQEEHGRFSPDGRWIVYTSGETDEASIYINSFPDPGHKYRVIPGRGLFPKWPVDEEIYYLGLDAGGTAMRISVQTDPFRAGTPRVMFPWNEGSPRSDMTPDGRHLRALPASSATPPEAVVVLNWTSELGD